MEKHDLKKDVVVKKPREGPRKGVEKALSENVRGQVVND